MIHALTYLTGLVIGSFGNVLIARTPDGLSIRGRSRCPHCQTQLQPRDLVPVVSWLVLGGRCRQCQGPISFQYPVVEILTATLFYITAQRNLEASQLVAWLMFIGVGVPLAAIDLKVFRLPNPLVFSLLAAGTLIFAVASFRTGEWDSYSRAVFAAIVTSSFFLLIRLLSRGGMGLGDVKLALVTGLYLGYESWSAVVFGTFSAFLMGALVGLVLIAFQGASRKTRVPFGPFMLIGAWASYWVTPFIIETFRTA